MAHEQQQQGGAGGKPTGDAAVRQDAADDRRQARAAQGGGADAPPAKEPFGPRSAGVEARQELRDSVYRLLRYAVSEAMVSIDSHWVSRIAPILSKDERHLDASDERALWLAYHALSRAIAPASDESLKLREHIQREAWHYALGQKQEGTVLARLYRYSFFNYKLLLWVIGILFLVLQGYALFLSNILHGIEQRRDILLQVNQQIVAVRQAGPDLPETKSPLSELIEQRDWARLKMKADYAVLHDLSFFWGRLYPDAEAELEQFERFGGGAAYAFHSQLDASMQAFHHGARSVLNILNYLVLPTLLGLLGSLAYVIRGLLDSYSRASYTLNSRRRWETRVSLGGLLGLIMGAVFVPDLAHFDEIKFSPMVWAFLVGYSVEFAFSVFDTVIERGRQAMQTDREREARTLADIGMAQAAPVPAERPASTS